MADIKDILGVPRSAGAGEEKQQPKQKEVKMKRPEGMSREAFALLGDSHPIISSQLAGSLTKKDVAKKPKPSTKGIPTYQYRSFLNAARGDGLELKHWVKCYKSATGVIKEPEEEYSFAKYNKKVAILKYDADEYESLIKPHSGDWSKEETDLLFELIELFDLRWAVIADRYEFPVGSGSSQRSMEDLKDRYYSVSRRLLTAREGGEATVANHTLMKYPYNAQHEKDRKAALQQLLSRTAQQAAEENAVLAEAKQIEERRKAEGAAASRRAGAAPAAAGTPRTASPAGAAARPGAAAAAATGGASTAAAGASTPSGAPAGARSLSPAPQLLVSELRHPADFPANPGPGIPSLFDHEVKPVKLKPGVYARGAHAQQMASTMAASMSGGSRAFKNVETTLAELGWPSALAGPTINTRPVCGAWLALRSEVIAQHELKRNLQNRINADGGGVAAVGAVGGGGSGRRPEKRKKA